MVTSYYIMKMNKKTIGMDEYYSGLHNNPLPAINKHFYRKSCRVCLQNGNILITNITNCHEMTEILNIFANIEIKDEDPIYLCNTCCKFLNSAILFRKVAHRTNEILRQSLYKNSPDHHDDYDPSETFEDDQMKSEFENNEVIPTEYLDFNKDPDEDTKIQFLNNPSFKIHLQLHNPDQRSEASMKLLPEDDDLNVLCPVCNELLSKSSYKLHLKLKHPINIIEDVPDHLRDHEYLGKFNEMFKDSKSNLIYSTKAPKVDCNRIQCPICKKLLRKTSYRVHLQLHNRKTDQQKKRKVQVESNSETQDQWPICPICKKVFTPKYFNKHLEIHNSDNPTQYMCEICGKTFRVKNAYISHKFRHKTGVFKCKLCPYASQYKESLRRHMRLHTGQLKYLCTHCPARYESGESLTCHMRRKHTKPQHKCDTCDKAFYNNLNLQRHIDADHLGIKNHECEICGATFGYRVYLLKHQRRVHNSVQLKQIFSRSIYDQIIKYNS